jgi:DNA-binding NarL/FixJ family response regulator
VAKIRILIANDHELVRCGIRALLEGQPNFHIVSEASNGVELVSKATQDQPDDVLVNIGMPELN